ncbi:hypothetical protein [Spiroplasma endosymbiont of Polydrusus pterygomalis]|uniref:hypothetical protein n=1 Tax=Spiroplasma endosymbiont of Polydrusus pterygomalis TaxID=3139327 RepID=UPI003CCB0DD4
MKKLIVSSFVLSTLLATTPQINTLTTVNTKIHHENNLQKWTPTPEDFQYIEKYFKTKTVQEIQELKENLLSAIGLKNDVVTFDKTKLNQKIWDLKIYQIITSDKYLQVLNWYYKNKIIIFDEQGKAHFNFFLSKKVNESSWWIESYAYWFGYWRLHLSSSAIEVFINHSAEATEIAEQLAEVPFINVGAVAIAAILTANAAMLKSYDYGRGAWMGWYILIPCMGFGSN